MQSKQAEILKVAESMVRQAGYNGFSFRNIATAVGIKSASVHYHYPTKEDLASALAQDYADRFIDALGEPEHIQADGRNAIADYIDQFRTALNQDKRMCLCGILGAEADNLPDSVKAVVRDFFERNIEWLARAYQLQNHPSANNAAVQLLAKLEGALMLSIATGSNELFEQAVADGVEKSA